MHQGTARGSEPRLPLQLLPSRVLCGALTECRKSKAVRTFFALQHLYFRNNQLSGTIPSQGWQLPNSLQVSVN